MDYVSYSQEKNNAAFLILTGTKEQKSVQEWNTLYELC
jgi:hypothetical protein